MVTDYERLRGSFSPVPVVKHLRETIRYENTTALVIPVVSRGIFIVVFDSRLTYKDPFAGQSAVVIQVHRRKNRLST